jgi:hypothetical protein
MSARVGRLSFYVGLVVICGVLFGCAQQDVLRLASDETAGRDNNTPGSALAREFLIDELAPISQGLDPTGSGREAFTQAVPEGTNVVAVIRGTELPNRYVIVGAHYDHLGSFCGGSSARDRICNGATDNAAGVAAVLGIARSIAAQRPRRSVVIALWDREEDSEFTENGELRNLIGSTEYVEHPLVPLDRTVAYVNFDIQGANLLPSLRNTSFAIASETGGPQFQQIVRSAIGAQTLNTEMVSEAFGQDRSDYVPFIRAGVPSVFFTDATGPCYHTVHDEIDIVDFDKLEQQIAIALRVTRDLANTRNPPTFVALGPDRPIVTYDDVVVLARVLDLIWTNRGRFSVSDQDTLRFYRGEIRRIVLEGRAAFGSDDLLTLVNAADAVVNNILPNGQQCRGFVAPQSGVGLK